MISQMRAMRMCGLGYAFFWSCTLYIVLRGVGPVTGLLSPAGAQQLALVIVLVIVGVRAARRERSLSGDVPVLVSGFLMTLSGLAYVFCLLPEGASAMAVQLAGMLLGVANAMQFLLWQRVYANEGQTMASIYLPIACAVGSLISLVLCLLPADVAALYLVAVGPYASMACLLRCTRDMEPYAQRSLEPAFVGLVFSDLWRPVLCASITCLAWSFSKHFAITQGDAPVFTITGGFGLAALLVLVLAFRTSCDFGAPNVYRVVLPILGAALFAPALFGLQGGYVLGVSLAFGAHLMTLLASIIAASYAARTQFSPSLVFLAVVLPSQIAILLGDAAGSAFAQLVSQDGIGLLKPAAVFIIALFVVMRATSRGHGGRTLAEPADDTLLINPPDVSSRHSRDDVPELVDHADSTDESPAGLAAQRYGLTAREGEVFDLLLKGNTMSAISRKLCISDNTTRGHMKRIYCKLNVHSRQELVDKVEGAETSGV